MASLTGPNGLPTQWSYDWVGRKTLETRADSTTTSWTYTRCVDNPGGCPTYGAYLVTETTTGAPTKTTYLDSLNREFRTEVQGFDGTLIRKDTQYDALERVAQVSKPYYAGQVPNWTTFSYDVLARVTDALEPTTTAGTAKIHNDYSALVTTVTVSNNGSGTNMPGAVVQTKTTTQNSQGQVAQVADTQNNTVTYSYDPFGNLTKTVAGGVTTTIVYDLRGRKTSMTDPDMGYWTYHYDALGELIWQCDPNSRAAGSTGTPPDCAPTSPTTATLMQYDLLSRLTNRTERDLVSTWVYDNCIKGVGRLCSASATNGYSRTQSYDSLGRPSTLSVSIDVAYTTTITYDSASRVDTLTYPTGFAVKNIYNAYGYLWKVQHTNDPDTTVYWQANSQSPAGQITSELLGNGLTTTRTYDALFRMTGITSSNAGGAVHNFGYTLDAIGNVIQRQDLTQNVTENFAFDVLNRLTSASGPGLTTRSFNYDATGNLTYKSDVGTYTYPAVAAALPHAVSSVSGSGSPNTVTASYGYDANGNLYTASGTFYPASGSVAFGRTLNYMSFNLPNTLSHVQGGLIYSYTYTYNPEHERVKLVTVRPTDTLTSIYLHPAGKGVLLYEKTTRQSDGLVVNKHYVNGGAGLIGVFVTQSSYGTGQGPEMRYYHREHLGSVAAITNPAAAVAERLGYEAFGERRYASGAPENRASPLIGVTTDRGFTAHQHLDEMMLIHMNGRIYDPIAARFMTTDPFVADPRNLQSFNRYAYAFSNPLGFVDPNGYQNTQPKKLDGLDPDFGGAASASLGLDCTPSGERCFGDGKKNWSWADGPSTSGPDSAPAASTEPVPRIIITAKREKKQEKQETRPAPPIWTPPVAIRNPEFPRRKGLEPYVPFPEPECMRKLVPGQTPNPAKAATVMAGGAALFGVLGGYVGATLGTAEAAGSSLGGLIVAEAVASGAMAGSVIGLAFTSTAVAIYLYAQQGPSYAVSCH